MSFLSELHRDYHSLVVSRIQQCLRVSGSALSAPLPRPSDGRCVLVEGFWLQVGSESPHTPEDYVITESVRKNLRNLARVISARLVLLNTPRVEDLIHPKFNQCIRN